MPTTDFMPEPMPATEPEPAASSIPGEKPEFLFDQVCQLDEEVWLIDWETKVTLPTLGPLSPPVPAHEPLLPLEVSTVCSAPPWPIKPVGSTLAFQL